MGMEITVILLISVVSTVAVAVDPDGVAALPLGDAVGCDES